MFTPHSACLLENKEIISTSKFSLSVKQRLPVPFVLQNVDYTSTNCFAKHLSADMILHIYNVISVEIINTSMTHFVFCYKYMLAW